MNDLERYENLRRELREAKLYPNLNTRDGITVHADPMVRTPTKGGGFRERTWSDWKAFVEAEIGYLTTPGPTE